MTSTPLPVVAQVSRIVTRVVDRITGNRSEYPLLVAAGCVEALKKFNIEARMMYGPAGWIEVLEDHSLIWAGCWGEQAHFWVATQFGEVVDLNTSVACRKGEKSTPHHHAIYSPPMLWSAEIPRFYRYIPEGIAEIDLTETMAEKKYKAVIEEIQEKCGPVDLSQPLDTLEFPNEPILCSGRKLLDDSKKTFQNYDRALAVQGITDPPAELSA